MSDFENATYPQRERWFWLVAELGVATCWWDPEKRKYCYDGTPPDGVHTISPAHFTGRYADKPLELVTFRVTRRGVRAWLTALQDHHLPVIRRVGDRWFSTEWEAKPLADLDFDSQHLARIGIRDSG